MSLVTKPIEMENESRHETNLDTTEPMVEGNAPDQPTMQIEHGDASTITMQQRRPSTQAQVRFCYRFCYQHPCRQISYTS